MDAAISVIGTPSNDLGGLLASSLPRTPAKSTIASRKPSPQPRDETIDSTKLNESEILFNLDLWYHSCG